MVKEVICGGIRIPKTPQASDEMKIVYNVDTQEFGTGNYVTREQYDHLIASLLETRVDGKPVDDTPLGIGFMNYILTKAGVKWEDRRQEFAGKSVLRKITGYDIMDRFRVIGAGVEGLLYGVVSWDAEYTTCDFIAHLRNNVDNFIFIEANRIRGEHYGLAEEAELTLRHKLSGSYGRKRAIAKAVNYLERRNIEPDINGVLYALAELEVPVTLFGSKKGETYNHHSVRENLFRILNPVRCISYNECLEDDFSIPLSREMKEITNAINTIETKSIQVTMSKPNHLTVRHLEGYSVLMQLREELMVAIGEAPPNGVGAFSAKEAEIIDLMLFSDLPLVGEYGGYSPYYDIAKERAKLALASNSVEKKEILDTMRRLFSSAYVEVPNVEGAFDAPSYGSIPRVPLKGFSNTWVNKTAYRLSVAEAERDDSSVDGQHVAENINFVRNLLFNKLRKRGYLDPNSPNALSCIRTFYLQEHGLPLDYQERIPEISAGPTANDLAEGSGWRRRRDFDHWVLRQKNISSGRMQYGDIFEKIAMQHKGTKMTSPIKTVLSLPAETVPYR